MVPCSRDISAAIPAPGLGRVPWRRVSSLDWKVAEAAHFANFILRTVAAHPFGFKDGSAQGVRKWGGKDGDYHLR
jgi:hypothetical protein